LARSLYTNKRQTSPSHEIGIQRRSRTTQDYCLIDLARAKPVELTRIAFEIGLAQDMLFIVASSTESIARPTSLSHDIIGNCYMVPNPFRRNSK
jgi:hypothetical protein